jgi:hypothetical protein
MTAQVTWSIDNMTRNTADGGVTTVYWSCTVTDDTHSDCSAVEAGKLQLEPDASADGFTTYEDLTEAQVLGWVYESLIEGEETADEAKTRIEDIRKGKVDAQVAKKTAVSSGMPWITERAAAQGE